MKGAGGSRRGYIFFDERIMMNIHHDSLTPLQPSEDVAVTQDTKAYTSAIAGCRRARPAKMLGVKCLVLVTRWATKTREINGGEMGRNNL